MKFIFFVLYVLQFLPFALLHKLADLTGLLAYLLVKHRRRIGEINLAKCFPEWDGKKRETVLKQHFKHMAKLMLEYGLYWYAPAGRLKSLVRYRNKHYLDDALAAGGESHHPVPALYRVRDGGVRA
ncbi:bacterial lipid A biosynthesis acyltransferase family protein [Neisseria meningitidis NM3139]|nr:bacterial lipid A biosynthesis acyltransferase family protein [Neisseria meningitidis NM3139]